MDQVSGDLQVYFTSKFLEMVKKNTVLDHFGPFNDKVRNAEYYAKQAEEEAKHCCPMCGQHVISEDEDYWGV